MTRRGGHISRPDPCFAAAPILCLALAACPVAAQTTRTSATTSAPRSTTTAPSYTAAGIVNAATGLSGAISPNAIVSIYGTNLAFGTEAATGANLQNGGLPLTLDGVTVHVGGFYAGIFFVSPNQINFLVPYELLGPAITVTVARQNIAGPSLTVPLAPVSPAFFQWNNNYAVAQHADGSLVSPDSPAQGGEIIVLYSDGLGRTHPDITSGYIAGTALPILAASQLQILVGGNPCPSSSILYAGVTPGFAGLYQINLRLPDTLAPDSEIRIAIGSAMSPAGVQLYTR